MIAISSEYTNKHGLPGHAFNPPEIPPSWRDMGGPCAPVRLFRQISRQFGGIASGAHAYPGFPTEIPTKCRDSGLMTNGLRESRHRR